MSSLHRAELGAAAVDCGEDSGREARLAADGARDTDLDTPTRIAARIALAAPRASAEGVQRLLAALSARGADARAVVPGDLVGLHPAPQLVLCRLASGRPQWELSALLRCELRGLAFVDPPSRLRVVHDKSLLLATLAARGVPVPPTLCITRDASPDLSVLPGTRFVVKPVSGSAGRGVTPGLDRAAAARAAAAFADLSGPVLVQPRLGGGDDVRLFMLDGEPAAAMRRRPAAGDGRASLHYGARAEPHEPLADEQAAARAAVAATGLRVCAVDLLRDDDGRAVVLEVNACPGLAGIEGATGIDLAGRMADLMLGLAAAPGPRPGTDPAGRPARPRD